MKKPLLFFCLLWHTLSTTKQKVALISIPKCGTHLLMNCVEFLADSNGVDWPEKQFRITKKEIDNMKTTLFAGHFLCNASNKILLEHYNFKAIFIIRDPRDQIVSMMYWLRKHPMSYNVVHSMDDDTLLTKLITNHTGLYPPAVTDDYIEFTQSNNIADFYAQFLPWRQQPYVLTITFESLIGNKGDGNNKEQKSTVSAIIDHLQLENCTSIRIISHYMYGHSMTFRKGKIGSWKEHFTHKHKQLFKDIAGQLLIDLGYEKDFEW